MCICKLDLSFFIAFCLLVLRGTILIALEDVLLENVFQKVKRQHYLLFQIDREATVERQCKYNNIKNVCLSVSLLVKLFIRFKVLIPMEKNEQETLMIDVDLTN